MIETPDAIGAALNEVLNAYRREGLPGTYTVVSYNNIPAVIPARMTNKAGSLVDTQSLLQTHITLPAISRTRIETLFAIMDATSVASKRKINYETLPPDAQKITFGVDDEPSGSALARLADAFIAPFTCHIVYDPQTQEYYANFRWLPTPPVAGPVIQSKPKILGPKKNNPYFTLSK